MSQLVQIIFLIRFWKVACLSWRIFTKCSNVPTRTSCFIFLFLQLTADQLVLLLELLLEEPELSAASMHALHKIYNLHRQDAEVRPMHTCLDKWAYASELHNLLQSWKWKQTWCVVNSLVIRRLNPTTIHFMFSAEQSSLLVLLTVFLSCLCANGGKVCSFKVPSPRIQQLEWENISPPVNRLYLPPSLTHGAFWKEKFDTYLAFNKFLLTIWAVLSRHWCT